MAHATLMKGLRSGYDGVENSLRTSADQKFEIWFDPPVRMGNLHEESVRAAREVHRRSGKEIVVLYSGGADSEWILESFYAARIPVTPLIVQYENGLNENDLWWARRYISRRGINNAIWSTLNLRDWYNSKEMLDIAKRVQTPELAYTAQFQAIMKHDNGKRIFVTGYDEPQIVADDSGSVRQWNLVYMERHYSVAKFFTQYGISGVSWGGYSPELFASYVLHPQWQLLVANFYNPLVWNSETVKPQMLSHSFPFMEYRPKYTGFENALDIVVTKAKEWQDKILDENGFNWTSSWSQNLREIWAQLGVGTWKS